MSSGVPAQPRKCAARRATHTQGAAAADAARRVYWVAAGVDPAPSTRPPERRRVDVIRERRALPHAIDASSPPHTINKTQVHAAFDVQDTEAWSNADDLRTPSEVKAELARLRQLALACVTAKMDNKKVNDKIDLNARPRRPAVPSRRRRDSSPGMMEVGGFFFAEEAIPRRPRRRPPSTRLPS